MSYIATEEYAHYLQIAGQKHPQVLPGVVEEFEDTLARNDDTLQWLENFNHQQKNETIGLVGRTALVGLAVSTASILTDKLIDMPEPALKYGLVAAAFFAVGMFGRRRKIHRAINSDIRSSREKQFELSVLSRVVHDRARQMGVLIDSPEVTE